MSPADVTKIKVTPRYYRAAFNHVFTMGYLEVNFDGWLTHKIVNIENISTLKIERLTEYTDVKYLL